MNLYAKQKFDKRKKKHFIIIEEGKETFQVKEKRKKPTNIEET
jgi:hypothetical protein